jgi:hypothetical protein
MIVNKIFLVADQDCQHNMSANGKHLQAGQCYSYQFFQLAAFNPGYAKVEEKNRTLK